jgi:ketol-acid reductoisomerase
MMRLTIIGFGNQAKAWAQNLQDSLFPIRVALRPDSPSFEKVVEMGLDVVEIGSPQFFEDQAFVLLTPDHTHHAFMTDNGHLFSEGSLILYNHGYSLLQNNFSHHFPHLRHILFAIKAIGSEVRAEYLRKGKLGAVYSLEHIKGETENVEQWLKELAVALGINMGIHQTTFQNETQADLFSEQGLLCSLIPYTANEMFKQLIENGIEPELAYLECWHELKLIVSAMVDKGPEGFYDLISPNALIGSEKGFQRLITEDFKANLATLFTDIKNNKFQEDIDNTNVEELRIKIRKRWQQSPLTETFRKINQEQK